MPCCIEIGLLLLAVISDVAHFPTAQYLKLSKIMTCDSDVAQIRLEVCMLSSFLLKRAIHLLDEDLFVLSPVIMLEVS